MGWGWMGLGLIFWIALTWLVIWGIQELLNKDESKKESPLEILNKRFAKGELSKKDYNDLKAEIKK